MPKYSIPVTWSMMNNLEIEADSLEEAIKKAESSDIPSKDAEYIDDSFAVNTDMINDVDDENVWIVKIKPIKNSTTESGYIENGFTKI